MNKKELELEAEKYAEHQFKGLADKSGKFECVNDFIAGATSDAAKKYWYKKLKKYLADKYKNCSSIPNKDMLSEEQYLFKIASDTGIRVFIKELKQKLSEL